MRKHQQYCKICVKGPIGMKHELFMRTREVQWVHPWSVSVCENGHGFLTIGDEKNRNGYKNPQKPNWNTWAFSFSLKFAMFYIDYSDKLSYSFICKFSIRDLIFFNSRVNIMLYSNNINCLDKYIKKNMWQWFLFIVVGFGRVIGQSDYFLSLEITNLSAKGAAIFMSEFVLLNNNYLI